MTRVIFWRLALALASMLAVVASVCMWVPIFVLQSLHEARDAVRLAWLQACTQRRLEARKRLNFLGGGRHD